MAPSEPVSSTSLPASRPQAQSQPQTQPQPQPQQRPQSQPQSQQRPMLQPHSQSRPQAHPQPQLRSHSQVQSQQQQPPRSPAPPQSQPQSNSRPQLQSASSASSTSQAQTHSHTQSQTQTQTQSQPQSQTQTPTQNQNQNPTPPLAQTRTLRSTVAAAAAASSKEATPTLQGGVIEVKKKAQEAEDDEEDGDPEGDDSLEGEEGDEEGLEEEDDEEDEEDDEDDDIDNFTTSEIVTVFVGHKRKRFFLHRGLICDRSPFMEKCLKKDRFDEGYKNEVYLSEDDPKAFSIIVDWIYRSKIPQRTDPAFDVCDMSAAYGMADKFGMEELQNTIMDHVRMSLGRREGEMCKTPHFAALALTHSSGPPKSPLKRFLVEHMVFHMMKHPKFYQDLRRNEAAKNAVEDLFKIPDLVCYIMRKIWQYQTENWKDPAIVMPDRCCYHVHSTTACHAKQAAVAAKQTRHSGLGGLGMSAGSAAGLHGHTVRPGQGWPGASLGGVWHPGVGW
ncbi:hypothetical protein B0A52_01078 [Exophiala mesophila]|uniref:BTB domain-containing protein n=1 Tax=Exophiala mesophila TaxID=212818 RepID=A0A438NGE7_EXOME|nr:hypothetical protein B0A52_01078 [Exophiala mesophila]